VYRLVHENGGKDSLPRVLTEGTLATMEYSKGFVVKYDTS